MVSQMSLGTWVDQMCAGSTYIVITLENQVLSGFAEFWSKTITEGPWPSGPIWFLWVLLAFDVVASILYKLSPTLLDPINRLSLRGHDHPARFFAAMLAVTAVLYIPGRVHFGPYTWFEFGPFSVQHGRVLLYATYFFFGAGIGVRYLDRGLLASDGELGRRGLAWTIPALVPYCLMWVMIYIKREILGNPPRLPDWYEAIYALFFAAFSVAIMFTILAYFLKFKQSGWSSLDLMQPAAFGMFLVHYPIVLWLSYWMFDLAIPAIAKGLIAFVLTVLLSWGVTEALRKIPGARHVL